MKITKSFGIMCFSPLIAIILTMPAYASQSFTFQSTINCGTWLKARKVNTAQLLESNLVGLVDGLALGRGVEIWQGKGVTVTGDQLSFWMDSYCQKNPLNFVATGAFVFANERTDGLFDKRLPK